jgi:hypothetical protein
MKIFIIIMIIIIISFKNLIKIKDFHFNIMGFKIKMDLKMIITIITFY